MYCSSCGQANDNNAYKCVACGAVLQGHPVNPPVPPPASAGRPHVPNNLVWAILCTLLCCLPGGIVAIVYAAQVDGKVAAGDIAGAQASARNAATWCWVSAASGLVLCVIYFFIVLGSIGRQH